MYMHQYLRAIKQSAFILVLLLSTGAFLKGDDEEPTFIKVPDVVYVGTAYDLVSDMLHMAEVKKGNLVVDLGCGDGRMLVLAAQKYGTRGIGYDIDPDMVRAARDNAARNKVDHLVKIVQADIFTVDISEADVIPVYLLPEMNLKLLPQFEKLKPGSRLVFHNYDLEGIVPDVIKEVISNEDHAKHTLYLYTTPLKRVR
jgi:ribosomal protein L11 methylase PrmA